MKMIISVLFVVIISLIALVSVTYIGSTRKIKNTNDSEAENFSGSYKVFQAENGLYGVINDNNLEIISAQWKSIDILKGGKFIVSADNKSMGIIDNDGNVLSPFIYKSFSQLTPKMFLGETLQGKIVLYSPDGNIYIRKEWDSCTVNNDVFILNDDQDVYKTVINNNKIEFNEISLSRNLLGDMIKVKIIPDSNLANVIYKDYIDMTEMSLKYITNLFENNTIDPNKLFSQTNFSKLSSSFNFSDYSYSELTDITPVTYISGDKLHYECRFSVKFTQKKISKVNPGKSAELSQSITLIFQRDDNSGFIIADIK